MLFLYKSFDPACVKNFTLLDKETKKQGSPKRTL